MRLEDFQCYKPEQLNGIFIGGISPESMTYDYSADQVKIKRFKQNLINDEQVFIVSTQKKKPVFRFREGVEIDINNPYGWNSESRAICVGATSFNYKGFQMVGYIFQYI